MLNNNERMSTVRPHNQEGQFCVGRYGDVLQGGLAHGLLLQYGGHVERARPDHVTVITVNFQGSHFLPFGFHLSSSKMERRNGTL